MMCPAQQMRPYVTFESTSSRFGVAWGLAMTLIGALFCQLLAGPLALL